MGNRKELFINFAELMKVTRKSLEKLFNDFKDIRVLILGDVMIDSYLSGRVDRISPEAPVPVVLLEKSMSMPGGAANVALNIKELGAVPVLVSVTGKDSRGREFAELLHHAGVSSDNVLQSDKRITTGKSRIIGNKAQLLRLDEETDADLNREDSDKLLHQVDHIMNTQDIRVIILQDYNKGVLTAEVIRHIIALGRQKHIPVVVDPKKKNFSLYKEVDFFKPNLKELREGLKLDLELNDLEKIKKAAADWQQKQNIVSLMVTLSENGVYMREQLDGQVQEFHIPAHLRNIADVSGAGDTVISVASLCRALGADTRLTAAISNIAGGLVCEQVGVVPVNGERLFKEAIELLSSE